MPFYFLLPPSPLLLAMPPRRCFTRAARAQRCGAARARACAREERERACDADSLTPLTPPYCRLYYVFMLRAIS
jgi:hypothetical protein